MLCMPVLELLAILVKQLKQMPFYSKMASHTFSMLSRVLYLSLSQMDISAMCLSPTTNKSTSVMKCLSLGSMCNALLKMPYFDLIIHITIIIHMFIFVVI